MESNHPRDQHINLNNYRAQAAQRRRDMPLPQAEHEPRIQAETHTPTGTPYPVLGQLRHVDPMHQQRTHPNGALTSASEPGSRPSIAHQLSALASTSTFGVTAPTSPMMYEMSSLMTSAPQQPQYSSNMPSSSRASAFPLSASTPSTYNAHYRADVLSATSSDTQMPPTSRPRSSSNTNAGWSAQSTPTPTPTQTLISLDNRFLQHLTPLFNKIDSVASGQDKLYKHIEEHLTSTRQPDGARQDNDATQATLRVVVTLADRIKTLEDDLTAIRAVLGNPKKASGAEVKNEGHEQRQRTASISSRKEPDFAAGQTSEDAIDVDALSEEPTTEPLPQEPGTSLLEDAPLYAQRSILDRLDGMEKDFAEFMERVKDPDANLDDLRGRSSNSRENAPTEDITTQQNTTSLAVASVQDIVPDEDAPAHNVSSTSAPVPDSTQLDKDFDENAIPSTPLLSPEIPLFYSKASDYNVISIEMLDNDSPGEDAIMQTEIPTEPTGTGQDEHQNQAPPVPSSADSLFGTLKLRRKSKSEVSVSQASDNAASSSPKVTPERSKTYSVPADNPDIIEVDNDVFIVETQAAVPLQAQNETTIPVTSSEGIITERSQVVDPANSSSQCPSPVSTSTSAMLKPGSTKHTANSRASSSHNPWALSREPTSGMDPFLDLSRIKFGPPRKHKRSLGVRPFPSISESNLGRTNQAWCVGTNSSSRNTPKEDAPRSVAGAAKRPRESNTPTTITNSASDTADSSKKKGKQPVFHPISSDDDEPMAIRTPKSSKKRKRFRVEDSE